MRQVEDMSGVRRHTSPEAVKRYHDMRFGMFVHWGLYAMIGHGEWVMHTEQIPVEEYEKLPPRFNPVQFNADEWARVMLDTGQQYMVITSKHHDGFCMFDSELTDYKITNTPFRRDPIAELAEAFARNGLKLGFYYSLLDWHHPDYRSDWSAYVTYYQGQVRELCTRYGDISMMWFDGFWPDHEPPADYFVEGGPWDLAGTYDLIHELQPDALIGNNHHISPLKGEDFQMYEQDLPGENRAGFNTGSVGNLPLESCLTINNNWGYAPDDHDHKSTSDLIRFLIECIGRDSNLLLNVGPTPMGNIQPEHSARMRGIGNWVKAHAESVYGTRSGPLAQQDWGYTVHNPETGKLFLHILSWPGDELSLDIGDKLSARLLADGKQIPVRQEAGRLILSLPDKAPDGVDTVVVLD